MRAGKSDEVRRTRVSISLVKGAEQYTMYQSPAAASCTRAIIQAVGNDLKTCKLVLVAEPSFVAQLCYRPLHSCGSRAC